MTHDTNTDSRLTPGPTCAAYTPLLPLLHTGELTEEQATATREHLADCAFCRKRLAQYDTLYVALRSRFDPEVVAADIHIPSVSEIAQLGAGLPGSVRTRGGGPRPAWVEEPEQAEPLAREYFVRRRVPRWFEAIAAILLISLLGGLFLWQHSSSPGGLPPLDAQSQAYVAVLRADYLPLLDAIGAERRQCVTAFDNLPTSDKPQAMAGCRPMEVTAQTDSQTLLDHLQVASVPQRWQDADAQLKTWVRAQIDYYTARIQAIDVHDVTRFKTLGDQGTNDQSECSAIEQINAELPAGSQLPPQAGGYCGA